MATPRRTKLCRLLTILLVLAAVIGGGAWRSSTGAAVGEPRGGVALVSANVVRVATLNIHSGVGADGRADLSRTLAAIKGFDLVGLNEVRGAALWQKQDQAMDLAQRLNCWGLFAPTERQWWHDAFGNGLMATQPPVYWSRKPMTGSFGRGRRNMLYARFLVGGSSFHVLVTHIDRGADRANQLAIIHESFLNLPLPAVVMGDFNTRPTDPLIERFTKNPQILDVIGRSLGEKRTDHIDWIFTRGLKVRQAGLSDNGASDHPVAWAELEYTD